MLNEALASAEVVAAQLADTSRVEALAIALNTDTDEPTA